MLRSPRALVKVGGKAILPISWDSSSNSFYQADTFNCLLPLSATDGISAFGDVGSIEVEILASGNVANPLKWDASDLTRVFFGMVDDIDIDPIARTVTLTGRDLTGKLIDTKTSEQYRNKTASQIAETLAQKYGLTPKVQPTTIIAGRYYSEDKGVKIQDQNTEWDLLTWLARQEGFVAYVQGKDLHFEPAPDETKDPVTFTYVEPKDGPLALNAQTIKLGRSLSAAKDITVTVMSWQPKTKKRIEAKASRQKKGKDAGTQQAYSYSIPNLTTEQAHQRAQKILADLTQHELKLNIDGPSDYPAYLGKTDLIKVVGTNSSWDTVYHPASINRNFDSSGYKWAIEAKNHGIESDVNV